MKERQRGRICAHFNLDQLHVKPIVQWVPASDNTPATLVPKMIRTKADARTNPSKLTLFANSSNRFHQNISTKQIHPVLQASPAVATYVKEDPRVREFSYDMFRIRGGRATLGNEGFFCNQFLALHFKLLGYVGNGTPSVFEIAMFLYGSSLVEDANKDKAIDRTRSNRTGMHIRYALQKISNSLSSIVQLAKLLQLETLTATYTLFDPVINGFLSCERGNKAFPLLNSPIVCYIGKVPFTIKKTSNERCGADQT